MCQHLKRIPNRIKITQFKKWRYGEEVLLLDYLKNIILRNAEIEV